MKYSARKKSWNLCFGFYRWQIYVASKMYKNCLKILYKYFDDCTSIWWFRKLYDMCVPCRHLPFVVNTSCINFYFFVCVYFSLFSHIHRSLWKMFQSKKFVDYIVLREKKAYLYGNSSNGESKKREKK